MGPSGSGPSGSGPSGSGPSGSGTPASAGPGDRPAPREKWNRRYAEPTFEPFPAKPAQWLVENRDLLVEHRDRLDGVQGRALDVACGDGRNSRFLADLGYAVEAIDVSDVAIAALRAAVDAGGPRVEARVVDLETEPLVGGGYAVIVKLNYLQRDLFPVLAAALRPGGLLVVETFSEAHVGELGNRFDPRFVLGSNELLRALPDLVVLRYREGVAERSGSPRGVAGIVAQRPRAA